MASNSQFDLIIVGAGINGAGIARDASMRGLRVLILDRGDLASGTSSWSTRLIHGGLRYLEHGELHLVRESLRERENLLRIAPHLVRPLPILIPIYRDGKRGPAKIRAGMIAYDLLSRGKSLPRHRMLSRPQTVQQLPGLATRDLLAGALFYDCQVEFAERLVLENVLSAQEHGAEILTYAKVIAIENGTVHFVNRDSAASEKRSARLVINASGPWVDELNSAFTTQRLISGTKGSHIVVPPFPGAPNTSVYTEAVSDQRPFFVIPWNHNYLIGTTDVRFEDGPDLARTELWEVDYLLNETNRIFPSAKLQRTDICYTYTGVRPLASSNDLDEQAITRRHFIRQHPENKNLMSIVGGKLTAYRSLAEECVDLVIKNLGMAPVRCSTHEAPLPGAVGFVAAREGTTDLESRLLRIYGSRTAMIQQLCEKRRELAQLLSISSQAIAAEIVFSFEVELAQTLADCLLRRTMIGLNQNLAIGEDESAAEIGKRFLRWSDERARTEVRAYREDVEHMQLRSLP